MSDGEKLSKSERTKEATQQTAFGREPGLNSLVDQFLSAKTVALLVIALGLFCLYVLKDFAPTVRLIAASLGMIGVIKIAALIWQISDGVRTRSRLGLLLYLLAWPGISSSNIASRFLECSLEPCIRRYE